MLLIRPSQLRVNRVKMADGSLAYATNGAPSDCVALAVLGAIAEKVDLVVSGINRGANLGHDVTYSGTVAGAMEGVVSGLPAIAVSLDSFEGGNFGPAAQFVAALVPIVLQRGLPRHTLLNVNVPDLPEELIKGVEITRLGTRVYRDVLVEREDPRGRKYYWIGGEPPTGVMDEDGTDVSALARGYISITPIDLDMTKVSMMDELRKWPLKPA